MTAPGHGRSQWRLVRSLPFGQEAGPDTASGLDAAWFAGRPGAVLRHRPAILGEFQDQVPVVPEGTELWVEVEQLRPGSRTRRPYLIVTPPRGGA